MVNKKTQVTQFNRDSLIKKYRDKFNDAKEVDVIYSPGRVNLIGEHIDYNGGLVFPAAISIGTYGVVGKRTDHQIRFYSANYPNDGIIEVTLKDLSYKKEHGWANYAKGILAELQNRGHQIPFGLNLYVEGNLPTASGLSSSASLELLVAFIANQLYHLQLTRTEMALLSQHVENEYMGMHCGIMDQLIIANGMKDHALLMDTSTLQMTPTPAAFKGYQLIIMNTNYKRKTTDSKYNERVKECSQAKALLQTTYPVHHLCELKPNSLPQIEKILANPLLFKRVKHVVNEQQRTIDAMTAMKTGNVMAFGKLLDQSHESLKNDYEVTGLHLDTLVESAKAYGAVGARVTGAGFGGCAIALVKEENMASFKTKVAATYLEKTAIEAAFYTVTFTDGVNSI